MMPRLMGRISSATSPGYGFKNHGYGFKKRGRTSASSILYVQI